MRITPDNKFLDLPCAHVAIGIAYERRFHDPFPQQALSISRANGYCTLREADSAIRHLLPVRKKVYFKRNERMALSNGAIIKPPAFFIILASPFLSPKAAGNNSVRRVSMQLSTASFLSGYLSVTYCSYPLRATNSLLNFKILSIIISFH